MLTPRHSSRIKNRIRTYPAYSRPHLDLDLDLGREFGFF